MALKVDHFAFRVFDLDKAIIFYRETLGLKLLSKTVLENKNVPIIKGPLEISKMVKWLYIANSDNNIIEFVEWVK